MSYEDNTQVVELIENGCDVDEAAGYYGWTPLLRACRQGHANIASALVAAGAAVDAGNAHGWTALHVACFYGHANVISVLLAAGAALL